MSRDRREAGAVAAMYVGLVLTVVATAAPYVDRVSGQVLADHISHGYPAYSHARVEAAVTAWLTLLSVVGVFGAAGWVATIVAVRAGRRRARALATALLVVGTCCALAALTTKDTSGEVGLAPLFGWIGMLPSVAGSVAVALLWRSRQPRP